MTAILEGEFCVKWGEEGKRRDLKKINIIMFYYRCTCSVCVQCWEQIPSCVG